MVGRYAKHAATRDFPLVNATMTFMEAQAADTRDRLNTDDAIRGTITYHDADVDATERT